jgi:hypothetical protein
MRVLLTGTIAGLPDSQYVPFVRNMSLMEGRPMACYDLVGALESTGDKKLERMLGATNYLFEVLREREYRKIGFELMKRKPVDAIIRAPATIQWNGINVKLKDAEEIATYVQPDAIVTLIDAEWDVVRRIKETKDNPLCDNLKKFGCNHSSVLYWMNEEVSLSEDWAKAMRIPHYVVPVTQHPLCLYKVIKYPDTPVFYVSYSMTHADESTRALINAAIKRLCRIGLVIDPQSIEIPKGELGKHDRQITRAFTVHRDLHWFVGKARAVVAIHPYDHRPPLSTGMMDELGHARDYLKERFMVFPDGRSPFTTNSYIEEDHVFPDVDAFFEHLMGPHGYREQEFLQAVLDAQWAWNPLKREE